MWVFDATPLIYLAKTDRLGLLSDLEEKRLIPELVYNEVVSTGIEEGHPDARRIEQLVDDGVFRVVSVSETDIYKRLRKNDRLSRADVSVLSCAKQRDATAVMDEAYGRDVASTEGIETRGTAYLVLLLVKRDVLDPEVAREIIDAMLDAGWYCAPDVYAGVLQKLDSLDRPS